MIATDIQQSKRLLDAGLDPKSCDMEWINVDVWDSNEKRMVGRWYLHAAPCMALTHPKYIPAWSLSALWDLMYKSNVKFYEYPTSMPSAEVLDSLVAAVERLAKQKRI